MLRRPATFLTAVSFCAAFAASAAPAETPATAWASHGIDRDPEICRQRAAAALAREGWGNVHLSGSPALAVAAFKGPMIAVILCVDSGSIPEHSTAVIFVSGGENGQPDAERDRLGYYMRD